MRLEMTVMIGIKFNLMQGNRKYVSFFARYDVDSSCFVDECSQNVLANQQSYMIQYSIDLNMHSSRRNRWSNGRNRQCFNRNALRNHRNAFRIDRNVHCFDLYGWCFDQYSCESYMICLCMDLNGVNKRLINFMNHLIYHRNQVYQSLFHFYIH